jgi:outer membrane protein
MRKKSLVALLGLLVAAAAYGQQITRVAVVDLSKVISAFSDDSIAVRDFERKKSQVQTDIDKMSADIMLLMSQRADADKTGDKASSLRLREEIEKKTKTLTDYVSVKQAELDEQAKKLATTDAFSQDLYKKIQGYAEINGYSLVLNLKSSDSVMNAVLWYSPMIDITADLIKELTGKGQ